MLYMNIILLLEEEKMDFTTARSHDDLSNKRILPVLSHSVSHPANATLERVKDGHSDHMFRPHQDKNSNHLGRFAKLKRRISHSLNKLSKPI